ncbi:MAG TPA: hypothetical protein VF511_06805, partial [Chthoniobacterales bacterium]
LIAGELLEGDTISNRLLLAGIIGIAFALALASQRFLGNKLGIANIAAGQLLAVSFLAVILCWSLIGGSYVLQWPLVFGMAGMLVGVRFNQPGRSVLHFVFLLPALLILVPLAYMFFVSLLLSYIGLAAVAFLLTTLLAMAPPLFDRLGGKSRLFLILVFVGSILLVGAGVRLSVWSAAHPRHDTLVYSVNADENKAKWLSYDAAPDAWTSRMLGSANARGPDPAYAAGVERPVLTSDAAMVPLSAPIVTVARDTTSDGLRTLSLHVASSRAARSLVVRLPAALQLTAAGWNGDVQPVHDKSPGSVPWTFRFYNAPAEGVSLELRFPAQNSIKVWVSDTTPGLPPVAPFSPRPDATAPGYGSDVTLVARSYEL